MVVQSTEQACGTWCKSCDSDIDVDRGYCKICWEKWKAASGRPGKHAADKSWWIEKIPIGQILFSQAGWALQGSQ
eukprot:Skav233099  [mRNA]  locus=scaffold1342:93784:94665:+ [translate_table: standard]